MLPWPGLPGGPWSWFLLWRALLGGALLGWFLLGWFLLGWFLLGRALLGGPFGGAHPSPSSSS